MLARSLVEHGKYDEKAALEAYRFWLSSNHFDCGRTIASGLNGRFMYDSEAIPSQWVDCLLNCQPKTGIPHVYQPRPECFWPVDALELAEKLIGNN